MTVFGALLRAVNVGGTGKLPMVDLKQMCERAGFKAVRTYIASGNVVLESGRTEAAVKASLEATLRSYAGKSVGVLVRTAGEIAKGLGGDPFPKTPRKLTVVIFLYKAPPRDAPKTLTGQKEYEVARVRRGI